MVNLRRRGYNFTTGLKRHKFYTNSESAWSAMLSAIRQAKRSIYFESFIFEDNSGSEYNFSELFLDKSRQGVRVRVVLDGFGSLWLSGGTIDRLREAGVEVLFFNSWFRRIHRKILIIDEEIAFCGGVNIGKKYRKWLDLHLRLTSKNIVRSLVKSFSRSYFYCGGTDPEILSLRKKTKFKKAELWLLENFPWTGKFMLRPYYKEQIALARERVVLVTPYFTPHGWLIRSLKLAQARGVSIEIIIPQSTDVWFINFANHVFASSLSKTGIKFYLTKDMIHAKAILVDDKVGLVGSNNLNAQSFNFMAEASISFEKKEMVWDLKSIIEIWKKDAIIFQHSELSEKWYYKIAERVVKFLQPIL